MKKQYIELFGLLDKYHSGSRSALFSNQVAFDFTEEKYLPQLLVEKADLSVLFIPEHGFFAELQDQESVDLKERYYFLKEDVDAISMYSDSQKGFETDLSVLDGLDLIIIDIQDVGARYYTYVTTIAQLFQSIKVMDKKPSVILVDHPNLAGRQVEGTPLAEKFSSLIGWPGIPHRYGLTIGELSLFVRDQLNADFDLEIIEHEGPDHIKNILINPSPNIPQPSTLKVFTGQCLFEGTNISEGRGTTRPFEVFGAPFFNRLDRDWIELWNKSNREAILRPLIFRPVFHKYKDRLCYGFQLHPREEHFHSLWYSLKLIRELKLSLPEFKWREGPYEAGSHRKAMEILLGDEVLINFVNDSMVDHQTLEYISNSEQQWIELTREFILYGDRLTRYVSF